MSSERRGSVKESQVELRVHPSVIVSESVHLWSIEVLTHLKTDEMAQFVCPYERKRHCSVNHAFSAPLVCFSIATALLSLCHVAHLCRVAQFVQYLCTGDIEQ